MTDELPRDASVRVERARGDFVKGVVRPDRPGEIVYPSLGELAVTYDLSEANLAMICNRDDWLTARGKAMTYSAVVPFSAAVDANPEVVKRAEVVVKAMEGFDDLVFDLAKRAMQIAQSAIEQLESEEDPVRAIRALRSVSQTMESLHRTAKQAYDPAAVRPENTVNINVQNIQSSEDVVGKVAAIYARMEAEATARGIAIPDADTIDGEIVEDDSDE